MGDLIRKSHNVSILMYHLVCVSKYRRVVITEEVEKVLRDTCIEISKRYEIRFLEIGTESDHVLHKTRAQHSLLEQGNCGRRGIHDA